MTSCFRIIYYLWLSFSSFQLCASAAGNPAFPALLEQGIRIPDTCWSNVRVAFLEDLLLQKKYFARTSSRDLQLRRARLCGNSQIGCVAWNIVERCDIQFELGSGQFSWIWKQVGNMAISGHVADGLIWSGHIKLAVFEILDTIFAIDAHAGGWDWMKGHAYANGSSLSGTVLCEMRYWQIDAVLAQKIDQTLVPYIGAAVQRSRLKIKKLESGIGWLRSSNPLGLLLGCAFTQGDRIGLNLEWRGWFEQAISVSGQIRF